MKEGVGTLDGASDGDKLVLGPLHHFGCISLHQGFDSDMQIAQYSFTLPLANKADDVTINTS
eukprot:278138-Ditylum_brightwellii.AAC.1